MLYRILSIIFALGASTTASAATCRYDFTVDQEKPTPSTPSLISSLTKFARD